MEKEHPRLLILDASESWVSACITQGTKVLHKTEAEHQGQLIAHIELLFAASSLRLRDMQAIVVPGGPGSYTGLRIAASIAKGLAYGLSIPLIAVPTLRALFDHALQTELGTKADLICPMLDARRMEVYLSVFDRQGEIISAEKSEVLAPSTFDSLLAEKKIILFVGSGAEKCQTLIQHPQALFLPCHTEALFFSHTANYKFLRYLFENIDTWSPMYLKMPHITVSSKTLLI